MEGSRQASFLREEHSCVETKDKKVLAKCLLNAGETAHVNAHFLQEVTGFRVFQCIHVGITQNRARIHYIFSFSFPSLLAILRSDLSCVKGHKAEVFSD